MPQNYEPKFKKIVRLHIEQGRIYKGITEEYDASKVEMMLGDVEDANSVLYYFAVKKGWIGLCLKSVKFYFTIRNIKCLLLTE